MAESRNIVMSWQFRTLAIWYYEANLLLPIYTFGHFWATFVTFGSGKPQARQCHCRQPVPSQCRHLGQRRRRPGLRQTGMCTPRQPWQ